MNALWLLGLISFSLIAPTDDSLNDDATIDTTDSIDSLDSPSSTSCRRKSSPLPIVIEEPNQSDFEKKPTNLTPDDFVHHLLAGVFTIITMYGEQLPAINANNAFFCIRNFREFPKDMSAILLARPTTSLKFVYIKARPHKQYHIPIISVIAIFDPSSKKFLYGELTEKDRTFAFAKSSC